MDNLEEVMKYYGLEDKEMAEKLCWIFDELHNNYGDWGDKVSSYLSAILSGTQGTRSFISPGFIETYKSLFLDYGRRNDKTED